MIDDLVPNNAVTHLSPLLPPFNGDHEKFIEFMGRIAYWNHDIKMGEGTTVPFLDEVVRHKHDYSITEHVGFRVSMKYPIWSDEGMLDLLKLNCTMHWGHDDDGNLIVFVNGRHILEILAEGAWEDDGHLMQHAILLATQRFLPHLVSGEQAEGLVDAWPFKASTVEGGMFMGSGWLSAESAHEYDGNNFPNEDRDAFALATYLVRGPSRVTETQQVRHRLMSYTVTSGRGTDSRQRQVVIPPTIAKNEKALHTYSMAVLNANAAYITLRDEFKIPKQDARFIQPQGLSTNWGISGTLNWWNTMFGLRSVKPTQWEFRKICNCIQSDLNRLTRTEGKTCVEEYIDLPPEPQTHMRLDLEFVTVELPEEKEDAPQAPA